MAYDMFPDAAENDDEYTAAYQCALSAASADPVSESIGISEFILHDTVNQPLTAEDVQHAFRALSYSTDAFAVVKARSVEKQRNNENNTTYRELMICGNGRKGMSDKAVQNCLDAIRTGHLTVNINSEAGQKLLSSNKPTGAKTFDAWACPEDLMTYDGQTIVSFIDKYIAKHPERRTSEIYAEVKKNLDSLRDTTVAAFINSLTKVYIPNLSP